MMKLERLWLKSILWWRRRVRARLAIWRHQLLAPWRDQVISTLPGGGALLLTVDDLSYVITGRAPIVGFALTRGGAIKPVTAEGVINDYDDDGDVCSWAIHYSSGVVHWPGILDYGAAFQSLTEFEAFLAERRDQNRQSALKFKMFRANMTAIEEEEPTT